LAEKKAGAACVARKKQIGELLGERQLDDVIQEGQEGTP
jgi:hypothetical protein